MADKIQGLNVPSTIVPFTTDDVYATHDSKYGKGGWKEVATTAERDAIPTERRSEGMAVRVGTSGQVYLLSGGLSNSNWIVFNPNQKDEIPFTNVVEYTVTHNRNDYPDFHVVDTEGNRIETQTVFLNKNQIKFLFNHETSGKILMKVDA